MKEKKFKQSAITIILYLFAALMLVYTIYQIYSTCTAIASYYEQMGSAPSASEIISYVLQAVVTPLSTAVLLLGAGCILNETRKLNPSNYVVVEKPAPAPAVAPAEKKDEKVAAPTKKEDAKKSTAAVKKPAEKKATTTAKKPAEKKATTTAKKPAEKKPATAAKKPAAKKATTTKKPEAKKAATTAKKPAEKKPAAK